MGTGWCPAGAVVNTEAHLRLAVTVEYFLKNMSNCELLKTAYKADRCVPIANTYRLVYKMCVLIANKYLLVHKMCVPTAITYRLVHKMCVPTAITFGLVHKGVCAYC
jgi:hypothetical protein